MIRFLRGMTEFYAVMFAELAHTVHDRWKDRHASAR